MRITSLVDVIQMINSDSVPKMCYNDKGMDHAEDKISIKTLFDV